MAEKLKLKRLTPKEGGSSETVLKFTPKPEEVRMIYDFELVKELFPSIEFRPRELQQLISNGIVTSDTKPTSDAPLEGVEVLQEEETVNRQLMGFIWRRKYVEQKVIDAVVTDTLHSLSATDLVSDVSGGDSNEKLVEKVVSFYKGKVTTKEDF